jgi:hypothetical protein
MPGACFNLHPGSFLFLTHRVNLGNVAEKMKIFVKVKSNSKIEKIKEIDSIHFEIFTKSPPREGKANVAVIDALARHFNIPKSRIKILAGVKSRQKIFEIL